MNTTDVGSGRAKPFDLSGKVALVTGSGRGLGKAIAEGLAAAGAAVVTCARAGGEATAVAESIVAAGGAAVGGRADVTDRRSVEALVGLAHMRLGAIDVLVNNAGVEICHPADRLTPDHWRATLETNLVGCATCAQIVAEGMIARGAGGSIVNVSSIASTMAMPTSAAYGASKAGVNQLTRVLAAEWAPHGIRVNAIAPGFMDNVPRGSSMTSVEKVEALTMLARRGQPEELAGPAIFLASDAASYVTGAVLYVDGGATAL